MLSFLFKSNQIRIQTDGKFQLKTIKDQYNHNSDPSSHRLNLFNKILLEIFSRNLFFFCFSERKQVGGSSQRKKPPTDSSSKNKSHDIYINCPLPIRPWFLSLSNLCLQHRNASLFTNSVVVVVVVDRKRIWSSVEAQQHVLKLKFKYKFTSTGNMMSRVEEKMRRFIIFPFKGRNAIKQIFSLWHNYKHQNAENADQTWRIQLRNKQSLINQNKITLKESKNKKLLKLH